MYRVPPVAISVIKWTGSCLLPFQKVVEPGLACCYLSVLMNRVLTCLLGTEMNRKYTGVLTPIYCALFLGPDLNCPGTLQTGGQVDR